MYINTLKVAVAFVCLATGVFAQDVYTPLATMNGRSFTVTDLPAAVGNAWTKLPESLGAARTELLESQVNDLLLRQEAKKRSIDKDALIELEVTGKVADPNEISIKALYDRIKENSGNATLAEIRPEIVKYLRIEPEKILYRLFVKKLRDGGQVDYVKDINSEKLSLNDVLVNVNGESISYRAFKAKNGLAVYEFEGNVFDQVESSLTMIVDAAVYQAEAIGLGIPVNRLIANEITSKMTDFTPDEQRRLEAAFKAKLYAKYRVKYFIEEPKPFTQNVSADDDPFQGNASAPVTVVVFADYECPACAGYHPVIKNVVAKYGDRVRLVFRDFPLVKIHENAYNAALAANAARKQEKFFEYSDLLYENQESLDSNSLKKYALKLGLNLEQFAKDLESGEFTAEVDNDIADGERYGVNGTPTIFVNGYKIRTLTAPAFERAIERALAGEF